MVNLPEVESEGERIAADTWKHPSGMYLWTDMLGAIQTAIADERARHGPRTTPPARSYADGVEDSAKVADQAVSICDSDRCLAVFGAPEWAELSDDGKQWVVALVKETVARLHNQEGKSHGR